MCTGSKSEINIGRIKDSLFLLFIYFFCFFKWKAIVSILWYEHKSKSVKIGVLTNGVL